MRHIYQHPIGTVDQKKIQDGFRILTQIQASTISINPKYYSQNVRLFSLRHRLLHKYITFDKSRSCSCDCKEKHLNRLNIPITQRSLLLVAIETLHDLFYANRCRQVKLMLKVIMSICLIQSKMTLRIKQ